MIVRMMKMRLGRINTEEERCEARDMMGEDGNGDEMMCDMKGEER